MSKKEFIFLSKRNIGVQIYTKHEKDSKPKTGTPNVVEMLTE